MKHPLAALLLLSLVCTSVSAQFFKRDPGDEIQQPDEETLLLPPAPKDANLLAFDPGYNTPLSFYIDPDSLKVGKSDRIVRYILVIKSDSGARNVTYEGLRCDTYERKIYAYGVEGKWSPARDPQWKSIDDDKYRRTLFDSFFCPRKVAIRTPEEGLDAIRNGGRSRSGAL